MNLRRCIELLQYEPKAKDRKLSWAIINDHLDTIRDLILTEDIHTRNEEPLYIAVLSENYEAVELLLKAGADPTAPSEVLYEAVKCNNYKIVGILIEYGADILSHNLRCLKVAAEHEDKKIFNFLVHKIFTEVNNV